MLDAARTEDHLDDVRKAAYAYLALSVDTIGGGHLDVKVAVPCHAGRPVSDTAIFHEKSGVVEDRAGHRIAWTGSLNETAAGWRRNWESINVYRSWGPEPERVAGEERNFARLWANRSPRAIVLDVPDAARRDLLRFLPPDLPARLKAKAQRRRTSADPPKPPGGGTGTEPPPPLPPTDRRRLVWTFIRQAPSLPGGGARVAEATAAIEPWPHQVRAFERLYARWPPKLLIADEVGLGKTIQAGLLLRQAWLAGRAKRILVLAPRAVLKQWQIELREKFNLDWPIYDGRRLSRHPSRAPRTPREREVDPRRWHEEPAVIASSHLMRRKDRAAALVHAEPWDLIVLDEAHHARRRAAGSPREGGPNTLLTLMRALKACTQGLVLLTATPMQVHPVEVWDLLDLLGLPPEWTAPAERRAAVAVMRAHTPLRRLVSRHTRGLLRRYAAAGKLSTPVAERRVEDRFVDMSDAERDLYEAVDEHISKTYRQASAAERSAVGFVMTVYRRRLASSFAALRATLVKRRNAALHGAAAASAVDEDAPDDETLDEMPDAEDVAALAARALAFEERGEILRLRFRGGRQRAAHSSAPRRRRRRDVACVRSSRLAATSRVRASQASASRYSFGSRPFSLRKTRQVASATRLLPSTKGWLRQR